METGIAHQKTSGGSKQDFRYQFYAQKIRVMKEQITVSRNFKIVTIILISIGAVTFIFGLIFHPQLTWANYLIVNYYFLSLAMGGLFFFVIQNLSLIHISEPTR